MTGNGGAALTLAAQGCATGLGRGQTGAGGGRLPLRRREDFVGSDFRPQLAAFQPGAGLPGTSPRIGALAAQALAALAAGPGAAMPPGVPVTLLLPQAQPGLDAAALVGAEARLRDTLREFGLTGPVAALAGGQGGLAAALDNLAARAGADGALLLAADSLADRARLIALGDAGALFSRSAPYGVIPGEGAAALWLRPAVQGDEAPRLCGWASGTEPDPETALRDSAFTGLSDAAHAALDRAGAGDLQAVLSDWNNSRYRASELSYALTRVSAFHPLDQPDPAYPAMRLGDCGAALAALALLWPDRPGAWLSLTGNRDDGARSAVVIAVPPPGLPLG